MNVKPLHSASCMHGDGVISLETTFWKQSQSQFSCSLLGIMTEGSASNAKRQPRMQSQHEQLLEQQKVQVSILQQLRVLQQASISTSFPTGPPPAKFALPLQADL